jgi:hypothetical protein
MTETKENMTKTGKIIAKQSQMILFLPNITPYAPERCVPIES